MLRILMPDLAWEPNLNPVTRRLLWTLAVSVGLHALLLISSPNLHFSEAGKPPQRTTLKSTLRQPPAPTPPVIAPQPLAEALPTPREPVERNFPPAPREVPPPETPPAEEAAVEESIAVNPEPPIAAPLEPAKPTVSLAGLREYHMGLARVAGQFRRYPQEARDAGLRGRTVMRLYVGEHGGPTRLVLLSSSQYELLDQAALDTIALAASHTQVPESLRGQNFSIDLALNFDPEEAPPATPSDR